MFFCVAFVCVKVIQVATNQACHSQRQMTSYCLVLLPQAVPCATRFVLMSALVQNESFMCGGLAQNVRPPFSCLSFMVCDFRNL